MAIKIIATNKKAYHNFNLIEKWECGLVLVGPEVKSLRAGHASFADTFAYADKGELHLYNFHINPYEQASFANVEPDRPRKLLLHKKEVERISGILSRKGLTLIATRIYFNSRGFVKVEIALGQGKKLYDKREDIKKREINRDIDRAVKNRKK